METNQNPPKKNRDAVNFVQFTRRQIIVISFAWILTGAICGIVGVLCGKRLPPKKSPSLVEKSNGAIDIDKAQKYALGHREDNDGNYDWRENSYGTTYDTGRLREYIDELRSYMDGYGKDSLPGYSWKVAVVFGGAFKKENSYDYGLNTMFMPVLVKNNGVDDEGNVIDNSDRVIDIFTARGYSSTHSKKKPDWERNNPSSAYTYDSIYKKYYPSLGKKTKDCPGCIIYDEGNMFP
jgi:hypothetical protein